MATGSSAGPPWKSSARICAPLPRNAGQTGTSRRPSSRRRGSKAARSSSIPTARPTPKPSVSRIESVLRVSKAARQRDEDPPSWRRLRENGRDYYALHGKAVRPPKDIHRAADREALVWHNENRYLG